MGLISALASLLVLGALAAGVVFVVRRFSGRSGTGTADGRGVRRFFQYALLYGLMIVSSLGLSGLIARLMGDPASDAELARSLTFSIIGLPLFLALAWWSRQRLRDDAEERQSFGWRFYSTVAPLTALGVAMGGLTNVLGWVLQARAFDRESFASLLVWGSVWAAHWVVTRRLEPGPAQPHLALGSVIGLATGASGLIWLLSTALEILSGRDQGLVIGLGSELGRAGALAITGSVVWVVYWLTGMAREPRTPFWFAYVLPVGVGGGLVTLLAAGSVALYEVLVWFLGEPASSIAARHFAGTTNNLAAAVIGALVWWYHRAVLHVAETAGRFEIRRVYEYLMAGIGLLAAAGGVTTVLVAVIEALVGPGDVQVGTAAINTLLAAITLLVVGTPVWWFFWSRIQRAAIVEPQEELASPTRRIYLFVLFGLGGVVAVVSLLVGVFIVIEDMLENRVSAETVRSVRFPVSLLLTTGVTAAYHWAVYRQDRAQLPETERPKPRYVLLIGDGDEALAHELAQATGARVTLWSRTDGVIAPLTVGAVVDALAGTDYEEVTVISGPGGIEVIGVERR